jgi:glucose/arabinose dehydrogenase
MTSLLKRWAVACGVAAFCLASLTSYAAAPACDSGSGGITLPPGFCALVAVDGLGAARHLVVAPNGDVYVALQGGNGTSGGVVALRDANGDGRFEIQQKFGDGSVTGIALRNGYLYIAKPESIERYKMTPGQLQPSGAAEVVVSGLPPEREHDDKGLTFDGMGSFYINIGSPSNACQSRDRQKGVP